MRHPWVNIALLVILVAQVVSGYFGFVNGRDSRAWILWLHGIGAYALVWLLVVKGNVILNVFGRGGRWRRERWLFLAMTGLVVATLVTGLLWTFAGPIYLGAFSLMTVHIFLAVAAGALLVWHTWRRRWIVRVRRSRDRRAFLRGAGLVVAGGVAWWAAGRARVLWAWPGARRRFTGSYETGSFSGVFPRVSWINDRPPAVNLGSWRLSVDGAVARPFSLDYDALRALTTVEETVTLDCTGGWYTTQLWRGVAVADLLARAALTPAARSVTFRSLTGYTRRFSLAAAAGYFLALDVAGAPLAAGHGFPARLVAPGQRGVQWVKWVTAVEVNTTGPLLQAPLPLR